MMIPSSRTPEGQPHRCPVCHKEVRIEPSFPPGDAPCPHCGHLLWFDVPTRESDADQLRWQIEQLAGSLETSDPQGVGGSSTASTLPNNARHPVHLVSTLRGVVTVAAIIGFLLGVMSVAATASFDTKTMPPVAYICGIVGSIVVSVTAALSLCLRDALRQRVRAGHRVNPILRLYFASGWLSLIAWIGTAVGLTFLIVTKIMG